MESKFSLEKYFLYFMMYAFIGWFYEVFLIVVVYRWGYSDRGVFTGPYCVVYGVGTITFLLVLKKLIEYKPESLINKIIKLLLVFIGCMTIATAIELAASYMLELLTGTWPWQTYADYSINFEARIALSPSIRFGLGGTLFIYVLQPLFEKLLANVPTHKIRIIAAGIALILTLDIFFTILPTIVNFIK